MKKKLTARITQILDKEYPAKKHWSAFIYWWLSAHGYDHDLQPSSVKFTDGPNDGGIDAIAWPLESQTLNQVLVLQSKFFRRPPTENEISRFQEAIAAMHGPLTDFRSWLDTCRPDLHSCYQRLRECHKRHRYILISPADFDYAYVQTLRKHRIEAQDASALDKLERNHSQGKTPRLDEIRINGTSPPKCIAAGRGTRVWLFTAPVREFGRAYDRYQQDLFAGNIRYALRGQTAARVREGMYETLHDSPHEFVFSHNGITISGDGIHRHGRTVTMRSASIVNGAQTVSYLGGPKVMPLLNHNPARVIVKFVQADKPQVLNEIETKVACRSNNQNKVDPSDLMTELPTLVSLQRYFRRHDFHLERKKGEPKLYFGQVSISKERLCQVLAAVGSSGGAVKAKSKQKLFQAHAPDLFAHYDASEKSRAEALAWARADDVFWETINQFARRKRKKRAQLAEFASLRVFHRALQSAHLKPRFLQTMVRWHPAAHHADIAAIESFLSMSCKAAISALLRQSARDKKNEPAFYKALESVQPAVKSAAYHSRHKIRSYYHRFLAP